ncbi:glycosyl hydrolase family 18 protein [uncultured Pontibacter sp.]|uniref:glycosyl hydrolase family 18 protein n=1 Tax=uncultured Pontibacter sp. TaxID=453356 RepID=UPI00262F06C0|nr:glycosyl hydrolase family 18 protein [uncultured Pontibacter sp.]
MKRIFYLLVPALLGLMGCEKEIDWVPDDMPVEAKTPPAGAYTADNSFKIVAYFPAGRNPDSVEVGKYKMITHLNYAFLYPNVDGSLKPLDQPERFQQVMKVARENGVKVGISLAGPEGTYSAMAANPGYRTNFVKNVLKFVLDNDLDGVDLDWEYPRASKANNITFNALVKEMSDSLHKWHKFVSVAVTPAVYPGSVRDGIAEESMEYIDFFNIMMYDGRGWDTEDPNQHASYRMMEVSLDIWKQKGLPKEKAVLGLPAYGRHISTNAAITYRDLLWAGANPAEDSFTHSNGATYYYNGTETVKQKAAFAKEEANGLMMWEFYQDANGSNSLLKAANDAMGRKY